MKIFYRGIVEIILQKAIRETKKKGGQRKMFEIVVGWFCFLRVLNVFKFLALRISWIFQETIIFLIIKFVFHSTTSTYRVTSSEKSLHKSFNWYNLSFLWPQRAKEIELSKNIILRIHFCNNRSNINIFILFFLKLFPSMP